MSKYWQDRQKQLYVQLEKDEAKLNRKLGKYYDTQLVLLEKDIAAYYAKYGVDNVIQYKNLMLSLSDEDKRILMEQMDEFAKKYPQYAHLMPIRESIYKLNRLEGLQYSIQMTVLEIGAQEEAALTAHIEKWAEKSYTAAMGFGSTFNVVNTNVAKALVASKWLNGQNFSGRIWNNKDKLLNYLQTEFKNGVIRGDSYERMEKELRRRFGVSKRDAARLVYTEGTFILNESAASALESYYGQYKYAAVGDHKTCDVCAALNGQIFDFETRTPGTNFPPMHANCRCAFEVVIEEVSPNEPLTDSEIQAINKYLSSDSYKINEKLRQKERLTNEDQALIGSLDSAIIKLPRHIGIVYRSVDSSMIKDIDYFNARHKVNEVVTYREYTSSSTSVYDETMDIQMVIESKHGADLREFNQNEQEILFRRDSAFFVTRREGNRIWMTEI